MEITFNFEPSRDSNLGTEDFSGSKSHIKITSSKRKSYKNQIERYYLNHIGPGMPIIVLIQAIEDNYTISINEGDNIYYPSIFHHWAVNRVEVLFNFYSTNILCQAFRIRAQILIFQKISIIILYV